MPPTFTTCTPPGGDNTGGDPLLPTGCGLDPVPTGTSEELGLILGSGASVSPKVGANDPPTEPPPPPSPCEASQNGYPKQERTGMQSTGNNTPNRTSLKHSHAPTPQSRSTGNNTPNRPSTSESLTTPSVSITTNNNTPRRREQVQRINKKEKDTSPIFHTANSFFDVYDRAYNYDIETNQNVLKLATVRSSKSSGGDLNGIFDSFVDNTLNTFLGTQGQKNIYIPFNATTLGAYLYNTNFIRNSLNSNTVKALNLLSTYNTTSLHLSTYFINGLLNAVANGTVSDYSLTFFNDISNSGKQFFPNGIPTLTEVFDQRVTAYELIESKKKSLNTKSYQGTAQQMIQMLYIVPTDIDLTVTIIAEDARTACVRVKFDGTVGVVKQDGTIENVATENEFLNIPRKRSGSFIDRKITLKSNRDSAYQLPVPQLSMVDGLLGGAIPTGQTSNSDRIRDYSVDFSVTGINNSLENNVEVSSLRETLPEAMLFSLMKETITDLPSSNLEFRKTQATYKMEWQSGDDTSTFNSVVQRHSGPRDSYYIPGGDPIASYIMQTDSVDTTERYITLTFNDLNVDIPNTILPRRILTDFVVYFTDVVQYTPFNGQSTLNTYETGEPLKRSVRLVPNPLIDVQRDSYARIRPSSNGRGVDGRRDLGAMEFVKGFEDGRKIIRLSKSRSNLLTQRSILGKSILTLSSIVENYDLDDGLKGNRLPSNDFFSFFTLEELVNFIKVPQAVRQSLFTGAYNGISLKVYPLKTSDIEKTYLTSSRLKVGGSNSILSDQIQTVVPKIGYFPQRVRTASFEGGRG